MAELNGPTLHTLLGDAFRDFADLARKELSLFKAEMNENVRGLFMGLAMIVGAAVFAIVALTLLMNALVSWLATVVGSEALASLICAFVASALAIGLVVYGRSLMSASGVAPKRTVRSLQRDSEVLTERMSS